MPYFYFVLGVAFVVTGLMIYNKNQQKIKDDEAEIMSAAKEINARADQIKGIL